MIVITGYSHKEDGILIVSESLEKAAAALGMKIHQIDDFTYFTNRDEPQIRGDCPSHGTWAIESCELKHGVNLTGAMQW